MMPLLALLLHAALVILATPALAAFSRCVRERIDGHPDAPVTQHWRDLRRLWRKQPIRPAPGWTHAAAPVASLAATATAILLIPSFTLGMTTAPLSDLLVLAGLFAAARAALLLPAWDAAAQLAAHRATTLRLVADPALLLLILAAALFAGTTNLDAACAALREASPRLLPFAAALTAFATLLLAADSPAGDVYTGRDLALVRVAAELRVTALLSLLATVALPFGLAPAEASPAAWLLGACCWALKLGLLALARAALLTWRARLRPDRAPELAALGFLLAALAVTALFATQGAA